MIDTSAIVAILREEPERHSFSDLMEAASRRRMSAATYVEAGIVIDGNRDVGLSRRLDALLETTEMIIEPLTAHQARIARDAYRDFGRGSGSPAKLNFGDCFSYALAKAVNEPLLFKGDDFIHTDVKVAAA